MDAGKLRHRIQLWGKVKDSNELKQTTYKEKLIRTIRAEIIPQTGSLQRAQANTILSNTTHKIRVRYGSGKDVQKDMWFIYKDKRFDIKFVLNPYFRNEELEIFVEEVTT